MTQVQLSALHFEGRKEAAKRRLYILKSGGYLQERPRKAHEPAILSITRKGLRTLEENGILAAYPRLGLEFLARRAEVKPSTVSHELAVMDAKVAFHRALRGADRLSLGEFSTWPLLFEFRATPYGFERREQRVRPDGFVRIMESEPDGGLSEHSFFVEIDLSTEEHETLLRKAACYLEYFRSGGFAEWRGGERSEFKAYPFRVLFVVKTADRRNTLCERMAAHAPQLLKVCVATRDEVLADPLGAIWVRPQEYMKAVQGTRFERPRPTRYGHVVQTERNLFVEGRISKTHLLA